MSLSGEDGQILARSAEGRARADGVYFRDQRVLSHAVLRFDGILPEPLGHRMVGADHAQFSAFLRSVDDLSPDPVLTVERVRSAYGSEVLRVRNSGTRTRTLTVALTVAADLAQVSDVRAARRVERIEPVCSALAVIWESPSETRVKLRPQARDLAEIAAGPDATARLTWVAHIEPQQTWQADWSLLVEDESWVDHPVAPLQRDGLWELPDTARNPNLDRFVRQSLSDLGALLLADPKNDGSVFAAAGAPWYLTLFGRDSLWTARMMLPLSPRLAAGTLRVLADRQGKVHDAETEEAPDKILHELRRGPTRPKFDLGLPARYFGSVDATPLFVLLYVEYVEAIDRTGLDRAHSKKLLPHVCAALNWMLVQNPPGSPGWLRYESGNCEALPNHGWKDSADALVPDLPERRVAPAPITLAEVQAYAYEAFSRFAELVSKHDWLTNALRKNPLVDKARLTDHAEFMKREFHKAFYHDGCYVIAIDGDNAPVTGQTSNMGHLLGTGILDDQQSAQVAKMLGSDDLNSGWGLRTRARGHHHFNPQGYHSGAVWAHDTAIAIRGLALAAEHAGAEHPEEAATCAWAARRLAAGLIDAAAGFDYRLPELYAGGDRESGARAPLPFPTACRPQAWSAASAVAVWHALNRLDRIGLCE